MLRWRPAEQSPLRPAQARTWDPDSTNSPHFTVVGGRYLLSEIATGRKRPTVHGDQHSGVGRSRRRITIKDDDGRVLKEVDRDPDEATAISSASSAGGSPTVEAFEAAERRAVTVSGSDATHRSIIVRDTQDGIGSF